MSKVIFYVLLDHFGFIESFCKWWCGRFAAYLIGSSWFILLPIFTGSVEAAMSETGSSDSNAQCDQVLNLQQEVSAQIGACSTSQRRKPRAQTKWPSDIIKVAGFDSEGFLTNDDGMKRWWLICGLITRQRVGINVHFENLDEPVRQGLFDIRAESCQRGSMQVNRQAP